MQEQSGRWGLLIYESGASGSGGDEADAHLADLEKQLAAMRRKVLEALPGSSWTPLEINPNLPPERADVVIVGGGVVGWSIAYWLKKKEMVRGALKVVVVEKDPTVSPDFIYFHPLVQCCSATEPPLLSSPLSFSPFLFSSSLSSPPPLLSSSVLAGLHRLVHWGDPAAVLPA